jgi:hypothetical protein
VAPTAVRKPEVVETVRKRLAGDRHCDGLERGEIRQPLATRLLHLAEHDLLIRSMQRLPCLDPALEGPLLPVAELAPVTILQILEQGRGIQCRLPLQQRNHLAVPDLREHVLTRAPVPLFVLRHADPTALDPPRAALADTRLGARLLLRLPLLSVAHV